MIEYKCPYCGQDSYAKSSKKNGKFSNWRSVRNHTSRCVLNTRKYIICEYYGPIELSTIDSYKTLELLKQDYPKITFSSTVWKYLRNSGKTSIRKVQWTREDCILGIRDFFYKNGRIPKDRELKYFDSKFPSHQIYYNLFGSLNSAIEAAGFIANYNDGFGNRTIAKDGILYRSAVEAYFVDHFLFEKEEYEYEKPYGNGWLFDFYLPERSLYIEIDGGCRPYRIEEKINFCKRNSISCRFLTTNEIYQKTFKL